MAVSDTDNLRQERSSVHGDFRIGADICQNTLKVWEDSPNWKKLDNVQREVLHMVAHKVQRILTGDPDFADHWDDIAGYAHLVITKSISFKKPPAKE